MLEKRLIYDPGISSTIQEVDASNYKRNFSNKKNIIIKAGSDVLLRKDGELDLETMHNIGSQIVYLLRNGTRVTYVTSGAITTARNKLGKKASKLSKRSLSIVGQPRLMQAYSNIYNTFEGIEIGQVLLEAADFDPKHRKETKEGFDGFYNECDGLAIVNANDATWKGEVNLDNDTLTSWLYSLLKADLAIFLSTVDGLKQNYGKENEKLINYVTSVNKYVIGLAKGKNSISTIGGMEGKLRSIKKIIRQNGEAIICNGKKDGIILDVLAGKNMGTYFKS